MRNDPLLVEKSQASYKMYILQILVIYLIKDSWVILDFHEPAVQSYFSRTRQPAADYTKQPHLQMRLANQVINNPLQ